MNKEVIVIGAGAREHALAYGLRTSGARVYAMPGNAGMAQDVEILGDLRPDGIISYFAGRRPLVVIGPEAPLAEGWADVFRREGFPVVGPSEEAAQLESSKRFAKEVMQECGMPTAQARTAFGPDELTAWVEAEVCWPKVIKQSGLAAGKGVIIVSNRDAAHEVIEDWRGQAQTWAQGVLFEDYLEGYEISVQIITNGREYQWLPVAQDYKRLTPAPDSPNTGGMGAVAPIILEPSLVSTINRQIFDPMMRYLTNQQWVYRGVLYAGLMITGDGPLVLEFNVRLGDPECEVIVPLLDVDWYEFWLALAHGEVPRVPATRDAAVGVVLAARGYPAAPQAGMGIKLGEDQDRSVVYHAGTTRRDDGEWVSRGGRVLTVVGIGDTVQQARFNAYRRVAAIDFPQSYFRPDIGT